MGRTESFPFFGSAVRLFATSSPAHAKSKHRVCWPKREPGAPPPGVCPSAGFSRDYRCKRHIRGTFTRDAII